MSGIELLTLRMARRIREEQEANMTTQPVKTPKTPKSNTVLISLIIFAFALVGGVVAISTPAVATLAIILALVAVGIAVLSLRENL